MPTWKKLVVSGSGISQLVNDVNYVINSQDAASLSGSFSGSFHGDGSNITNVQASSIEFANILNAPTLVSGSSQVTIDDTTGFASFSSSIDSHLDANISALSASAATANVNLYSDVTSDISSLSASVDAHLDANISAVNTSISNLSSSVDAHLDANISSLSSSAHAQRISIESDLSSDISNVSASFDTTIDALDVRVDSLEAFSSSLDATFATDSDVTNLSSSAHSQRTALYNSLDSDISSLSSSVDAHLDANISAINTSISNLSSSVDAHLDANISAVNTSISNLSSSAATANTNLSASIASTVSGLSQTLSISSSLGETDVDLKTEDLTIAGDGFGITTQITGNTVNVKANGLLSSSAQVITKLDNQNADFGTGTVTANAFVGDGSSLTNIPLGTATSGDYVESLTAGTGITVTNNSGEGATPTIATAQDISDSASPTFDNLTLTGDLNVSGTTTTTNQTTLTVSDSKIFLADGNAGDSLDTAIIFNYNDGVDDTAGMFRDATDGSVTFFASYTGSDHVGNTIDTTNANYSLATIKAGEFDGNLSWNNVIDKPDPEITVALSGDVTGTGAVTLTDLQSGTLSITSSIPATTNLTLNDLTIDGNLTVTGTQTVTNTATISSDSPVQILNSSGSGNPDIGFVGKYDDNGNTLVNGFFRDATDGNFKVFDGSTQNIDENTLIDTTNAGFSLGTIEAGAFSGSLDWSYVQNVPDPTITLNVSGDISGSAQTTLTDLADGTLDLNLTLPASNNQTFNSLTVSNDLDVTGDTSTDNLVASGDITGSNVQITNDINVGGDGSFTGDLSADNLTLAGNLIVNGTTTTVNSTAIELGDNIIELTGTASAFAGLKVNDSDGPASGSLLWDGANNQWIAGGEGSEVKILLAEGDDVVSGSAQINISETLGYTSFSASIDSRLGQGTSAISASAAAARTSLSASVDAHLDANIAAVNLAITSLSASSDAHLDANISAVENSIANLSASVDVHLDANISALSSSAAAANTGLSSSFASTISGLSQTLSISGSSGDVDLDLKTQDLSIEGDGGGISTSISGNTISLVSNGLISGSSQISGDLDVTSVSATSITGSVISGSAFVGDGSGLTGLTVNQAATIASTFTNVTSTTVSHNFDSRNVNIVVYDTDYKQIIPASVTLTTTDSATIEFCEATSGTVVVAKGGHIVSGSVSADSIDGLDTAINNFLDLDGVVSSSAQVDIEQTTNFSSFSASIDARLGGGVSELSASAAQANTNLSSSFATTISGLSQTLSISGSAGDTDVDLKTEDLTFAGDGGGISTSISGNTVSLVSNGVVSGSSQVDITGTTGYAAFSSSIDAHLDANISAVNTSITNLSSSVDAHLDANVTTLDDRITSVSQSVASTIGNITTNLSISGSTGNDVVNLDTAALTIAGTAGEIETVVTNNQVQVGIVDNPILTGNVTVTGDLTVQGDAIQAQVSNLNVEDRFILLNSGSSAGDSGIIFGGSDGTANQGSGIFWDSPANVFGYAGGISGTSVTSTHEAKLGYIQQHATAAPSAAPSFQGVGSIHIKEDTGCIYIYA